MPDDVDKWVDVLKTALARALEERQGPVPGARLRQLVEKVAVERGLQYPPPEDPRIRFSQFLDRYSNLVAVRRRAGQDLLVAPSEKPDLLVVETPDRTLPGIRHDMFDAFTRILTGARPFYVRSRDAVEWLPVGHAPGGKDLIAIPPATLDDALNDRRGFASGFDDAVRGRLFSVLESPYSLAAFTAAIRDAGLQTEWHLYRTKTLADRIARWAEENAVAWQEDWLTASPRGEREAELETTRTGDDMSRDWRRALTILVQSLELSDLPRITLPLDIVLKVLQQRR